LFFKRRDAGAGDPSVPAADGVLDRLRGAPRTVIGPHTRFRGTLTGKGTVLVQGSLRGGIDLAGPLAVAEGGSVEAEVSVESARVSGRLQGSLRATTALRVDASGHLEGDISAPTIELSPGSVLRGRASIVGLGSASNRRSP
jgi:cytoskeletal protein CcmA (bactofilin family)